MAIAEKYWGEQERGRAESRTRSLTLPWLDLAIGSAIFLAAFSVYLLTLTPSLSYNSLDGAELSTVPYVLGLAHSTGYPLFTWLGKLFTYIPAGDVAHRMNLMSAAGAALGSALLYGVIKLSLQTPLASPNRRLVAVVAGFGALLFAFSRTLWSQAVITEVYAPNIAMVGLTFLLLLLWARHEEQRPDRERLDGQSAGLFGLFALVFGLSTGTHLSNLAFVPAFVLFILLTNWRVLKQPLFIAVGALGFGIGVAQFLWLPLKAADLNDPTLSRNTPNDLTGIYNYTLNAFPQMRWAFTLNQLPDRVILYLRYAIDNFHIAGLLLALVGAWVMAVRHPKAFFLFMPAYLFEVFFFIEYRVGDLDVFFIPSHFILAVFIAHGAYFVVEALYKLVRRSGAFEGLKATLSAGASRDAMARAWLLLPVVVGAGMAGAFIAAQPALSLAQYWSGNDQSANTGIDDFYRLVFNELPANSTLQGQSGVFGYDMFYWRLVYDWRPDVSIPGATPQSGAPARGAFFGRPPTTGNGQQTQVFTTTAGGLGGFGGLPAGFARGGFSSGGYSWPILASPTVREDGGGSTRQLTLYQTRSDAPQLFVTGVTPQHAVNASFGNLTLVGYDVDSSSVQAGGSVHLKLYWRLGTNATNTQATIVTSVGDTPYVETHALGFGNLQQYVRSNGQPSADSLLMEDYDLVVLSSLGTGAQPFRLRVESAQGGASQWADLGSLTVTQ